MSKRRSSAAYCRLYYDCVVRRLPRRGGGVVREKNVQEEVRNKKKRQKSIDVDDVDGESGRRDVPFHRARCLVLLKYI